MSERLERFSYDDGIVRMFVWATLLWGVVGMLVGVVAALQLANPAFNFATSWLSFGRLRPLHTNAVIFAFTGNAIFAGVYYSLQRLLNEKVDVLYPMSDNTLNSSFDAIGRAAEESGLPLFGSFLRAVEFGACAALGYDFYEMGLRTGRLVVRVKNGESPGRMPIQSMDEVLLYVNSAAASRQGVVFPKDVLGRAARIASFTPAAAGAPGPVLD